LKQNVLDVIKYGSNVLLELSYTNSIIWHIDYNDIIGKTIEFQSKNRDYCFDYFMMNMILS
jgi:hypothetical protein